MILASIVATYLPLGWGMWTTASGCFNMPWFYLSGLYVTGIALFGVWLVATVPPTTRHEVRHDAVAARR
ncbi:hypothetical protein ACIA03_07580 [Nocardioides sp. NPDC051685]|uniref:hypothetical protein n=1 Tax=Nocardioides sp. NPDC051685 TaxID=3364334 RepID=UPI00379D7CC8